MKFKDVLRRIEQQLDVPYPERKQALDEISSHLDALYADCIEDGASEDEAVERSLATMSLDEAFVESMSLNPDPRLRVLC